MTELEPLGHISEYGIGKLRTRRHYCVSVSYEAEKEYVVPIVTLSSAQSALDAKDARIAELEEKNSNLLLSAKMSADVASNAIDDMKAAIASATKAEELLKEAVAVLKPFASAASRADNAAAHFKIDHGKEVQDDKPYGRMGTNWGHLRAARSLYEKMKEARG